MHSPAPDAQLCIEPKAVYPAVRGTQTLLFDADDTLWENNVYFERAITGFVELLAHPSLTPDEVKRAFNKLEHERVKLHGYGTESFRMSMVAALEQLRGQVCCQDDHRCIAALASSIREAEMELLPGVESTLRELGQRHRLVLMTKGDRREQTEKLHRSGLASMFLHVEVVPEKHRDSYLGVLDRLGLPPEDAWMIGNSPRSDINPALAAGMHAVFVPHANTWVLEKEEIAAPGPGQHLIVIRDFAELTAIF